MLVRLRSALKRSLILITSFTCMILVMVGTMPSLMTHALPEPTIKIMVVGDSISHGGAGDWTWRYRLWQHLMSSGTSVDFVGPFNTLYDYSNGSFYNQDYIDPNFDRDHDATAGRMATDEKNTIAGYVATYTPNTPNTTNILLINLGTNDMGWFGMTGQQVASQMYALITNARTANPNIKIVLSKITPRLSPGADYTARWTDYNNWLGVLASTMDTAQSPIVLADPVTGFDPAVDTWDATHPSPSGEYKIAAAFANGLANPKIGVGTSYGAIPTAPAWPLAPITVTGTPADGAATVTWNAMPGAFGYYVYMRQAGSTGPFTQLNASQTTDLTYTVGSLVNGQHYEFTVSTVRGYFTGPKSTSVFITPQPRQRPAPTTPQMPTTPTRPVPTIPQIPTPTDRPRPTSTTPQFP